MGQQTEIFKARNAVMHQERAQVNRNHQGDGFLSLAPTYEGIQCDPLYMSPEKLMLANELGQRMVVPRRRPRGKTKLGLPSFR